MAGCIKNIPTKNYQNLISVFQVTVENVGDVFWDAVYILLASKKSDYWLILSGSYMYSQHKKCTNNNI